MNDPKLGGSLKTARQTCPEMLGALYVAHYGHVFQVCRRFFRRREDAEDAAAEVFLKLHRVLDKKDEMLPFRPWVSRVAARHCIDKLRQGRSEKRSCVAGIDVSEVPDHATPSPLSQILRNEEQRQLREHLIRLPKNYKMPLVLHYYQLMSYASIARTLNKPLAAVKTWIFRAKGQLRGNLGRPTAPLSRRSGANATI
jgi:RNA polymerase sigma-70 factor (ECF subfamily)